MSRRGFEVSIRFRAQRHFFLLHQKLFEVSFVVASATDAGTLLLYFGYSDHMPNKIAAA